MVIDRQTMIKARRTPSPAARRAVQAAMGALDATPARRVGLHRWMIAGATAVAIVAIVAAVPPLRDRAAALALDALGRAVPITDQALPADQPPAGGGTPTPAVGSLFLQYKDAYPYDELAQIATVVGASQTVNGVTVTVEEAALTVDKLYLMIRATDAPQNCTLDTDILATTFDGQRFSGGYSSWDTRYFTYCANLPFTIDAPRNTYPVHLALNLIEYLAKSDSGTVAASYALDFSVTMGDVLLQVDDTKGIGATGITAAPDAPAEVTAAAVAATQTPALAPEATATFSDAQAEATTAPTDVPQMTAMPSAGSSAAATDAAGLLAQYDIALGNKWLHIAVPGTLERYDFQQADYGTTLNLLNAAHEYPTEADGMAGVPRVLSDDSKPLVFFYDQKKGHLIRVLAYKPGTTDLDAVARRLQDYWTRGDTTTNDAGNEVTVFQGGVKSTVFSTLLMLRLPEGSGDGPFLVVQLSPLGDTSADVSAWLPGLIRDTAIR